MSQSKRIYGHVPEQEEEDVPESSPTIEGIDELRGEQAMEDGEAKEEESKWPETQQQSSLGSREMALHLLRDFNAEAWIKDHKVVAPRAEMRTLRMMLLDDEILQGDIKTLSEGYRQFSMASTLIWVRWTKTQVKLLVEGCKFFNYAHDRPRYLETPAFSIAEVRKLATADNYADVITALAYVDEVRRMGGQYGVRDKSCFVGKEPLHHLYFAATMHCALYLAYFVLEGLGNKGKLPEQDILCISVSPGRPERPPQPEVKPSGYIHPSRMKLLYAPGATTAWK